LNWNTQEAVQVRGLYRPTLYNKIRNHPIQDLRAQARVADEA